MNISIMMSVGCQNLGDELILKNEIKLLREKYGFDTNFSVFTYDLNNIFYKDNNIKYLEYFPIGIKNPKNIIRNLKNYYNFIKIVKSSDKIVIGGGGIFFDNEAGNFSNPLSQWLFRTEIIKMLKKEVIIFGVSIDIKYSQNLEKIKKIFSNAKEIFVRDKASFELLQDLGINSEVILDPVFHDNGEDGIQNYKKNYLVKKIEVKEFSLQDIEEIDFFGKNVGLALRSGYLGNTKNVGNYCYRSENQNQINRSESLMINEIIDFIINAGGKVILLPHSFHKLDDKANDLKFLLQFLKPGVEIKENMQEVYEIYKQKKIDFCLSMRLHSMILSQVYAIPFIGIKYSKKGDLM